MKLIIAICAATALAGTATAVQAQSQSDKPVVVRAQPDDLTPTRRVSYADLDLASLAGEKTLYHRVSGAVSDVCIDAVGASSTSITNQSCRKFAWNGAEPQMKRAIDRAREIAANGFSTIAPVAIMIAAR